LRNPSLFLVAPKSDGFLKRSTHPTILSTHALQDFGTSGATVALTKVFCFFFSKKKRLL
jgi:hypothetical protein